MRREVLPTRSKAFLVTFAAIGKSNCLPRHERQANSFLLISKSSFNLQHKRQANSFLHLSNCKSSSNAQVKLVGLLTKKAQALHL
jgi:hypothetical protein